MYVARSARAGAYAFRVDAVRGHRDPGSCSRSWPGCRTTRRSSATPTRWPPSTGWCRCPARLADLRRDLREAFLREGLSEDDVDLVMRDFHLTLNARA